MARRGTMRAAVMLWLVVAALLLVGSVSYAYGGGPGYVPGQVLVKFRPGTPASAVARAHAAARSAVVAEIPGIDVQVVALPRGLSVARATGLYAHNPNVEYAEPDYYVAAASTIPNDPWFATWQSQLAQIGGPDAWDVTTGSASVLLAVLDTGVDFSHPDLQGRLVAGWDFIEGDGDPSDEHGHGTLVTGVLGAATNNGLGVAAVSWENPVLCVRIADASGWTTWSTMAAAIVYAADQGARAINISFAGTYYSSTTADAVDYAWDHGTVTVAAAGNSSTSEPHYPAALPRVVAVAGVDISDRLMGFSNYGAWVDLCAPASAYTTIMGGSVGVAGGTSISAPHVVGSLGLVFAVNPSLSPQEAVDIVTQSAVDAGEPGWDEYYAWGRLDLHQAVLASLNIVPTPDATAPSVQITAPADGATIGGVVEVVAAATDNVGVSSVAFYVDGALLATDQTAPYAVLWDTAGAPSDEHVLQATARDAAGNESVSAPVSVIVQNTTWVVETFSDKAGDRWGSPTFPFVVQSGGPVSASLYWDRSRIDLDLYLHDGAGRLLDDSATSARPETIVADLPPGEYWLTVVAASGKSRFELEIVHQ